MPNKIIITILGGVIQNVYSDLPVEVVIVDHDDKQAHHINYFPLGVLDQDSKNLIGPATPIVPNDININKPFWGTFGSTETEIRASWVVLFCQYRGNWSPFSFEDFQEFYKKTCKVPCPNGGNINLSGLDKWIPFTDGKYHVTVEFIEKCYNANKK